MSYYFTNTIQMTFEDAIEKVTTELAREGFGIMTSVDVRDIFKKKLGVEFRNYSILGVCNPTYAYRALQEESHIGLLLPFNIVVYEIENGIVEVAAVDPENYLPVAEIPALAELAGPIRERLQSVISRV